MKNKKLNLDDLKVQSFVTDLNPNGDQTNDLKGGATWVPTCPSWCDIPTIRDATCPDKPGCTVIPTDCSGVC